MTELRREERFQQRLHKVFPIYEFMQLSVEQLGDTVCCAVPLSPHNSNHFGVMHAGVLFSLAEATAGLFVTQHREFGAMLIVAEKVAIEFRKPARSRIAAYATHTEQFFEALRQGLAENPKYKFNVDVELRNDKGEIVATCACCFQLRQMM